MKDYIFDREGAGYIFEIVEQELKGVTISKSDLRLYVFKSIVSFPAEKHYKFKKIDGHLYYKFKHPNLFKRLFRKWVLFDFIDIERKYIKMSFPDDETALLWYKLNY